MYLPRYFPFLRTKQRKRFPSLPISHSLPPYPASVYGGCTGRRGPAAAHGGGAAPAPDEVRAAPAQIPEFLRVYSPAADSKIRSVGGEKVIFGRQHVGIMSAESVGNYGVRILFDDLHKTGIFTWDYLHHLGSNKFGLMRNYIRTLRKHGLSRDPQRRK
ncbi:uncharacterized protein LOC8056129 isoform X2 [Sorghum bicolor]|uniref:uncharacterized protein LOC8056129 isoform X2 n=1 Tax=Sorghum bicolor TaxID=4558 RepID=UPI000B424C79|nr:uncharacterized protein LOC8056129 isoform X2 [Sorghum bicolor]|eukprot:XP_021312552.1 uncharacterized protein LOC8056129 isoform X2 [Sorghum bicolor]